MFATDRVAFQSDEALATSAQIGASVGDDTKRRLALVSPDLEPPPAQLLTVPAKAGAYDLLKRGMDLTVASGLIIGLAPLMSVIALTIRASSKGPAIFKQERLTVGGKRFTIYKFRTMRRDAESETGPVWASYCDPRVTAVGRFLRVTRLDELPQLFNVVKGDMSLIGPRPERPEMASQLLREYPAFSRRMEVKAGITGLAQIATGYASSVRSYRRKLTLDIKYVENRCLLLDLRIAAKTVKVVLTGFGAR